MTTIELTSCGIPAVLAERPEGVSEKYSFIKSTRVIDDLGSLGWFPTKVNGARSNSPFAQHSIRFRRSENLNIKVHDVTPEIVAINSHNGLSAFKLKAGLFRLVCSNGLVVAESVFPSISIKHIHYNYALVRAAILQYVETIPRITETVETLRSVVLSEARKIKFAQEVMLLRFGDEQEVRQTIDLEAALRPTRRADEGSSLWNVFNILQEKSIKGGLYSETGRKFKQITNVQRSIELNQSMYELAVRYAKAA